MLLICLGLIVAIIPFLTIFCFKNRLLGLLSVLTFLVAFHLIVAFITQLLHIFNYQTIISANIYLAIISLIIIFKRRPSFKIAKVNWFVIAGFIIIFFQLWSVHFWYTGTISTINGYEKVAQNSYPYPYFSDEWVGVSFVNYSIEHHALPLLNPLTSGDKMVNPLVIFFSFISEFFLLFHLNPLTGFSIFALLAGFIICLLSYILLRVNKVSRFLSIITVICITYITNGVNLPGLWYFLPYTMGLIMLLLSLISITSNFIEIAIVDSVLAVIFYPPIIIFIIPLLTLWLLLNKKNFKVLKYIFFSIIILALIVGATISLAIGSLSLRAIVSAFMGYLIRSGLDNGIPQFMPWNIIPFFILPIVLVGFIKAYKDKRSYLLVSVFMGLIFWLIYLFTDKVIIIEYARIVVITSILLVIISGFGLEWLLKIIKKKIIPSRRENFTLVAKMTLLLIIIFLSFSYTDKIAWSKLVLKTRITDISMTVSSAAPATQYLKMDDLRLFGNISRKRFISPPWKGLVIGVATHNFPLDSKPSIISNQILSYDYFMSSDCSQKKLLVEKYKIDYAYSRQFDCPNFSEVGISQEKLYLYKFK